jgi:hypothetical protein
MGSVKATVVYGAWKLLLACAYARSLPPRVYEAEAKSGMEKLGAVCVYPCPNMLVIVCCGIQKVGAEPSMLVQLWVEAFSIIVLPADVQFVCGLV